MSAINKKIIAGVVAAAVTVSGGVGIYFATRDKGGGEPKMVTSTTASDWVENYDFNETTNPDANVYENHTLPAITIN